MGVYKDNRPTKDGKIWFYKTQYEDIDGTHKTKKSGRYVTKKEAEDAEFEFKLKIREYENTNNVTFEEMIRMFIDFRKDKVKENTLYGYNNKLPYLKSLYKVKLKDFNYPTFERWHDEINSTILLQELKMIFISY